MTEDAPFKNPLFTCTADDATNVPVSTHVTGTIPSWLEGSLYRNGAGIFQVGTTKMNHLFDGMAVLHRFSISNGDVTYMSRVLDSDTWRESIKADRLMASQFGTYMAPDPCKTLFQRLTSMFFPKGRNHVTDNTSVNLVPQGDALYAMTETPWIHRVDKGELTSKGREFIADVIAVHMSTAHPHTDDDGSMFNLGTCFKPPNNYNIVRFAPPPDKDDETPLLSRAELLVSLRSRWHFSLHYNHSFGMSHGPSSSQTKSRGHFVLLEQPISMKTFGFITHGWTHKAPFMNFCKHPEEELAFRLISRDDNKETSIRYRAAPTFTFHFVNCYEVAADSGSFLMADFAGYDDLSILDNLSLASLERHGHAQSTPRFMRFVLPLSLKGAEVGRNLVTVPGSQATAVLRKDGTVFMEPDLITDDGVSMELPQINLAHNGRSYRYAYGTGILSHDSQLVKLDLETRKQTAWSEEGYQPGEPVFVPRPGATEEDDGVILSPVLPSKGDKPCFLLVLDAKTFKETARATTPDDVRMALSFHGAFLSS